VIKILQGSVVTPTALGAKYIFQLLFPLGVHVRRCARNCDRWLAV